jgi:hypothetical protein
MTMSIMGDLHPRAVEFTAGELIVSLADGRIGGKTHGRVRIGLSSGSVPLLSA